MQLQDSHRFPKIDHRSSRSSQRCGMIRYRANPAETTLPRFNPQTGEISNDNFGEITSGNDRRDSLKLAGLAGAGELTPIYVPDVRDEAMRDLVRTREDAVMMQRQARQGLAALLLRNDVRYAGKTAWTAAHRRWIADVRLSQPAQRLAFEEYVQAVEEATVRVMQLGHYIEQEVTHWRWLAVVNALQACRGIQLLHAVRIVAELGDLSRFSHPRQLMSSLGFIPSEDSSEI